MGVFPDAISKAAIRDALGGRGRRWRKKDFDPAAGIVSQAKLLTTKSDGRSTLLTIKNGEIAALNPDNGVT
ncbi:MAG: hypothetical protein ACJ74Z_06865 [Bryobacteraceae bacterium]